MDARTGQAAATVMVSVASAGAEDSIERRAPRSQTEPSAGSEDRAASTGSVDPGVLAGEISRVNRTIHYPALARKMEMQGLVQVLVTTGPEGQVTHAEIRRSSGHEVLDRAAVDSLRAWTFSIHDRTFLVPVRFVLE